MEKKNVLPEQGKSKLELKRYMEPGENYKSEGEDVIFLGYPQTTPHPIAIETYINYIKYNENQVGLFSNSTAKLNMTRDCEKRLIEMLGNLYGDATVDGYVTSGGTEGNIMGVWIGKYYLSASSSDEICVIKTYLSHHSIEKACSLTGIKNIVDVAYNDSYEMDLADLRNTISRFVDSGFKRFIIIATVGYTMTGTSDPVADIDQIIEEWSTNSDVKFYLHVDAAIGGFVYPFCKKEDFAFQYKNVMSLTVDPHKMAYIPYSSGIFLCRKGLTDYIAVPIKYAKTILDRTLISSRNGAMGVVCWVTFNHIGYQGFVEQLSKLIQMKEYLVEKLRKEKLAIIISDPATNMICLHYDFLSDGLLPETIEKKYILDAFKLRYKEKEIVCYKIYIMPHLTKESIRFLIDDLLKLKQIC